MKKFFNLIASKIKHIQEKRTDNSQKYKATNLLLTLAFPIFITTLVEIIHMKGPDEFVKFLFAKPSIILFNILFISMIFFALSFLLKQVYRSTAIVGIGLTTLSIVEKFKFNTSGNHLILTDLKLAGNTKNLSKFAYIKITPSLVFYVILLFIYIAAVFWFNPVVRIKLRKRLISSLVCISTVIVILVSPTIAMPVYSFFDIDTTQTGNYYFLKEKFENNNLIAFLAQTTTEFLNRKIEEPEQYNVEVVENLLEDVPKQNINCDNMPNVVFIMSEAFTDFRVFNELDIDKDIYKSYDNIKKESFVGNTVVPAFGSFTVKTEFELNFGLPVKSLNDPNLPQRLLLDNPREQKTVASYFKSIGYNTNYIHTYARTFYQRDEIYSYYGYDNMFFDDNLTVPADYFKTYISDTTVFNQVNKLMEDNNEPVFIHCTTMQNHQPYNTTEDCPTQLDYYLDGVKDMTGNLEVFLNNLEEPTVVFFVGDHFPCFKGEESIYNQLDINEGNFNNLYVQPYFIWNNFGMDYDEAPSEIISVFYIPYVVFDLIDAPKNNLIQTMIDKMDEIPIYTECYDNTIQNDQQLDTFTYDIVLGEQYIKEAIDETN